ncbi:MAG: sterol desaturase family protein [Hyphomicrobium sp.]|nr:sterol desaturase family protein [Hyphomicrobium sp.]
MFEWIQITVIRAVSGAMLPFYDFLTDATARYYWFYCLTGLLLAAYAYRRHNEAVDFTTTLLDKRVWLSQSAMNDYAIVVIIPVLRATVLSALVLNWNTVSTAVTGALHGVGVSGVATDGSAVALGVALTVVLFVVDDFLRWYAHYTFHRIPELWEFHKVHHSAEVLNFATSERHHPVEVVLTSALLAMGLGVVNGIFIAFFGDQLTATTVAGANIFLVAFNVFGGVLRHSPFWVSFGPRVEKWLISPAMHHIHHSNKVEHFDKNLGGALAIWDRMAGTLHIPRGRDIEGFGIGDETQDFRSLEVIFCRPFVAAGRLFKSRFGASDDTGKASSPSPQSIRA